MNGLLKLVCKIMLYRRKVLVKYCCRRSLWLVIVGGSCITNGYGNDVRWDGGDNVDVLVCVKV